MGGDLGGMYSFVPGRKFGFISIVTYRVQKSMRHYFNLQLQARRRQVIHVSFFLSTWLCIIKRRLVYIYMYNTIFFICLL